VDAEGAVQHAARLAEDGRAHLIVTANPETVMAARRDADLAVAIRSADLVVADGVGIIWAARRLGYTLPGRVAGIDLMAELCAWAAGNDRTVFLLGGGAGVAERAARTLVAIYPGLRVAGTRHGQTGLWDGAAVAEVSAARPDLLFAGLGMPLQEKWLAKHLDRLNVRLAMGVGGSLDVLAGRVRRAPPWARRLHLEWLYRLVHQPSRWRRQLALPKFVWVILTRSRFRR
jgi:N-acetylglucosaminyldiphosphoundecaprenol N-acetyl-beta-D-mannosaminyltransferase